MAVNDSPYQNAVAFGAVQDMAKIRLMVYQHGEIAHVSLNAVLDAVNKTLKALDERLSQLEKHK